MDARLILTVQSWLSLVKAGSGVPARALGWRPWERGRRQEPKHTGFYVQILQLQSRDSMAKGPVPR